MRRLRHMLPELTAFVIAAGLLVSTVVPSRAAAQSRTGEAIQVLGLAGVVLMPVAGGLAGNLFPSACHGNGGEMAGNALIAHLALGLTANVAVDTYELFRRRRSRPPKPVPPSHPEIADARITPADTARHDSTRIERQREQRDSIGLDTVAVDSLRPAVPIPTPRRTAAESGDLSRGELALIPPLFAAYSGLVGLTFGVAEGMRESRQADCGTSAMKAGGEAAWRMAVGGAGVGLALLLVDAAISDRERTATAGRASGERWRLAVEPADQGRWNVGFQRRIR